MSAVSTSLPILMLDFDGVVNMPLSKPLKENSDYKWRRRSGWGFSSWSSTVYTDDVMGDLVITTSAEMIQFLLFLEDEGLCQIAWSTMWTQFTPGSGSLLTREEFRSALQSDNSDPGAALDRYDFLSSLMGREFLVSCGEGSLSPSSLCFGGSPEWWKWDAVSRLRAEGHSVVFVDDLLHYAGKTYRDLSADDDNIRLVSVNPDMGFTRNGWHVVRDHLLSLTGAR